MDRVIAGIHEEDLGALSLEILDYVDRISEILERIDSYMDKLPACYKGSSSDKIIERYNSIKSTYPTVKENLKSYSDDFITLINKMREDDTFLSNLFRELTSDTNRKIKQDFNLK